MKRADGRKNVTRNVLICSSNLLLLSIVIVFEIKHQFIVLLFLSYISIEIEFQRNVFKNTEANCQT